MSVQLVDDNDPSVEYQPPWHPDPGAWNTVGRSRHGATEAGTTATLRFTGSGIQVFGIIPPSSVDGYPTTTYAIDDNLIGSYTPPLVEDGDQLFNVSFFAKHDLQPGLHQLVITNINGTAPNLYWLDYFLVELSPTAMSSPSTATLVQSSTMSHSVSSSISHTLPNISFSRPPAHSLSSHITTSTTPSPIVPTSTNSTAVSWQAGSSTSLKTSAQSSITSTTSRASMPTMTTTEKVQSMRMHTKLAAMIGGVVGGSILMLLVALLCIRKQRKWRNQRVDTSPNDSAGAGRAPRDTVISITSDPFGHMRKLAADWMDVKVKPFPTFQALPRAFPTPSSQRTSLSTSLRSDIASTHPDTLHLAPFPVSSSLLISPPRAMRARRSYSYAQAKLREHLYGPTGVPSDGAPQTGLGSAYAISGIGNPIRSAGTTDIVLSGTGTDESS